MKTNQEFVEINAEYPLRISVFESENLIHPFHFHSSEYELTLTIGGKGLRIVGDSMAPFGSTDLAIMGPGLPHCWMNEFSNGRHPRENIKVVVIHFNEHLFGEELLKRRELNNVRHLLQTASRGIVFTGTIRDRIRDRILGLKIDPDFGTWVTLYSIFDELSNSVEHTILTSESYGYRGKNEETDGFEKIHAYIRENFRKKIKMAEVAEIVDMNESAFSHYFKKRTLKNYTDFINELRLNHAAAQLAETRRQVSEIAFESGFNNLSNFNRIFKKWKGMTPHQWRKEVDSPAGT